ncbi:MAG: hypothetical protein KJ685_02140 [Nanoarchaeota archaeon]|nr:hypothetical protein [Nanoarchaeota archaeon]
MVDPNRVLSDVPQPHMAFWFTNGTIVRNIYELVNDVEACDSKTFEYHLNKEKNDFYRWILEVLGDDVLAKAIKKEFDQKKFVAKVRKRIKELEEK